MIIEKLEGSEIWAGKMMSAQERADGEAAHKAALEKVQNWIFSNLPRIKVTLECEDGSITPPWPTCSRLSTGQARKNLSSSCQPTHCRARMDTLRYSLERRKS